MRALLVIATLSLIAGCNRPKPQPEPTQPEPTHEEQLIEGAEKALEGLREANRQQSIGIVASLIDPGKLDTLKGDRPANRRARLIAYHLETSRRDGNTPEDILEAAQDRHGMTGTPRAKAVLEASLANLKTLEALGCLDSEGMERLRRGNAPTITKGKHAGTLASVDHTLPRSLVPELDAALFNLRIMAERDNQAKGSTIGPEEIKIAREWHREGLLSIEGLEAIEASLSD